MACHGCGLFHPRRCEYCGAIGDLSECGGLTRSAARIMMLSEPDFEAKLVEIRARGAARIAEAQAKEHAPAPPANVGDRDATTGRPLTPVGDVGAEGEALRGYRLALDVSLQAGHQSLKQIGQQSGLTVADVLRLAHEALAENRERLRVEAGVVSNGNG